VSIPPRDIFAAEARRAIEMHDEWDSPHCFMTLHWDGEKVSIGTYASIMLDIEPTAYPAYMISLARDEHEKNPDDPAYAYLLQAEFFGASEPGPDASDEEHAQFQCDRLGRTFHQRSAAEEVATAWCADVHGRLWAATKRRSKPGEIHEQFYAPGKAPGGQMIRGLLAVAYSTGMMAYGLAGPPWMAN
jgi:hypothetical protein